MNKRHCYIISNGIEDCSKLIKHINADPKTRYQDPDCFVIDEFEVKHRVETQHKPSELKRKYNQYKIEPIN